jgi:hypothetical protein
MPDEKKLSESVLQDIEALTIATSVRFYSQMSHNIIQAILNYKKAGLL